MERSADALDRGGSPSVDDVHAQLERILGSQAVRLSPRRRALLRYLVEETLAGRGDLLKGFSVATAVFGRDESFDPQADPVVRFEARRLRRDLASYYVDAGSRDPLRITIPKGGYVPHFEWQDRAPAPDAERPEAGPPAAEAAAPAGPVASDALAAAATPPVAGGGPAGGRFDDRPWSALLSVALVAAAASAAWLWQERLLPAEDARGPSVIVLPFAASGSGEDDSYFAAGMTQELVAQLARFPDLRLFSIPAGFVQIPQDDPRELGRKLGSAYVVQGSIRSEGAFVHVRAMLTDADDGEVLWNGTYDRPLSPDHILEVQEEISSEISATLGQPYGVLSGKEAGRLSGAPSMPSYACVLRAYHYRRSFSDELYGPARACLEVAVARDPGYADAWAMLGWLHLDAGRFGLAPEGRDKAYTLALEHASHAIGIDPGNILALKALGSIYHYTGHYEESVGAMRKALEINPNDPDAMAQFGWRLAVRGRFDEGIPYLRRAIDHTISPPGWYFHLIAVDDYLKGDCPAMLAAAERSAVDGSAISQSFIAVAQGALGNEAEARAALDRLAAISPEFMRDPAAAYRVHQPTEEIVQALVAGLRRAGWEPPAPAQAEPSQ